MDLAERHARIRAHEDEQMRIDAHRFVVVHFGGDYARAAWFLDEAGRMADSAYGELSEHTNLQ